MRKLLALLALIAAPSFAQNVTDPSGSPQTRVEMYYWSGGAWAKWDGTISGGPGAGLTDTELRATPVPISGTISATGSFWPTAAASPLSARLSDGSAFYDAAKTGQLPTSLSGGKLDVTATQNGTWNVGTLSTLTTVTNPVAATQSGAWSNVGVTGTFWPTTAASPGAQRLSDGSAFYDAAKTGQLPSALVSGRLDVNIGAASATNISTNLAQIGATTVVNGGTAGTLAVGGQAAHATGVSGNPMLLGAYAESDAAALDSTNVAEGDVTRLKADIEGRLMVTTYHPNRGTAGYNAIAASLTQIVAAPGAGLSIYIDALYVQTTTTTSGTYSFQSGTGSNCGTGTAAVFPVSGTSNRFNSPPTTGAMAPLIMPTPLKLAANTALCVIGVATNTQSGQVIYHIAP